MTGAENRNEAYTFAYDDYGRLTGVTDSAGRTMTYTYDSFGRKVSTDAAGVVQTGYAYDTAGRLVSIDSPAGTFSFVYDASNRRSELRYPNGVVATYGYDANGRLVDYLATGPQGPVAKSAYTLDGTGNRTSQNTLFDTTHYSYDAAMRLIESVATLPGAGVEGKDNRKGGKGSGHQIAVQNQAELYTYDSVGNRLSGPDAHDWYEYAAGNLLVKDTEATYQYDANGNLVMMQGADWWAAYEYDYENRLTRVTDSGGMDVSYKYDPMGRRIEKNVLGVVTRYFYDGEDIAFEYLPNGTVGNVYVHGPGVDEPLGLLQTRGMYYYHADGLGSIIGISDASASLVQSYEYDSFGNLKDRKNRVKQPYAYTGREYDRETGLYYYRARYYMPEVGRFLQEDPIGFAGGDVNLYSYVMNKPLMAIDPYGRKLYFRNYTSKSSLNNFEILPYNVLKRVERQIRNNSKLRDTFNEILCGKADIEDILFGDSLNFEIGIYEGISYWAGNGQTRWNGVFTKSYPGQPNQTIGLREELFEAEWLNTDATDEKEAARIIIHELAHIAEAYAHGKIWPGLKNVKTTSIYDTGAYIETFINW